VILRPAPVYGPGNEANLPAFVRQILADKPCLIGGGETRKSIVSRTNLCAAIEATTGRDFPLISARLRAIRETTVFPCDKLVAAGFTHPQTTRDGLAEIIARARAKPD
jgi:nucleoside-diphosphate-sugar epimerase